MGIYIKGATMPEECSFCWYFEVCAGTSNPCPLIEVKEPHGELIDRITTIRSLLDYHTGMKSIGQCIDDVPTIIEAEV